MAQQQREDTPKTGPAPKSGGATLPRTDRPAEGKTDAPAEGAKRPDQGHEDAGQIPDNGDFGPDHIGTRRG